MTPGRPNDPHGADLQSESDPERVTRLGYYRRLFAAYILRRRSQLTFWHETPQANPDADFERPGPYYMDFVEKADYQGPFDEAGVPMLDYRGDIGVQYNPIAIAQYGLGNFNAFSRTGVDDRLVNATAAADWLVENLSPNGDGLPVWNHNFDWQYRDTLRAPWYSGLAQGQGISLLVRMHREKGDERYATAARDAFRSMLVDVQQGGVKFTDGDGQSWIEEYIVTPPPTHILNGFVWGLWGVRDYHLAYNDPAAGSLWAECVDTIATNLHRFDNGNWSLYDLSSTGRLKMLASPFYHRLHIVQLRLMYRMTDREEFNTYADRWERYAESLWNRSTSFIHKSIFKLVRY